MTHIPEIPVPPSQPLPLKEPIKPTFPAYSSASVSAGLYYVY